MLNSHWILWGGTWFHLDLILMFTLSTSSWCLLSFCTVKLLRVFCISWLHFVYVSPLYFVGRYYETISSLFRFLIYMDLGFPILLNFIDSISWILFSSLGYTSLLSLLILMLKLSPGSFWYVPIILWAYPYCQVQYDIPGLSCTFSNSALESTPSPKSPHSLLVENGI